MVSESPTLVWDQTLTGSTKFNVNVNEQWRAVDSGKHWEIGLQCSLAA